MAVTNTPAVMEHLGGVQADPSGIAGTIERQRRYQEEHGYCLWIMERRADGAMLGFCGLQPGIVGPIAGEVEIGWRLRADAWRQGYAREAAASSLAWAWANLRAPRVAAITVPANVRSWGLMERLGMTRVPEWDFEHPAFAEGHPLRRHIGYLIDRP